MSKLNLLFILLIIALTSSSQSLSNYVFSTSTSSSLNRTATSLIDDVDMTTGTTILIGGSQSNSTSAFTPIGFDFFVNGTRQTNFNVTSNGWMGVGVTATTTQGFLVNIAGVRLAPMLGTTTGMGTSAIGRVHYKVVGAQPNRVLVVEYLRMAINSTVVNDTNTFQVRLYEVDGTIEYVYGRMNATITTSQNFNIGFQFSGTSYNNVNINTNTASSSNSTPFTLSSSGPVTSINTPTAGSNRSYSWTPNPPDDPGVITTSAITTNSMTLSWLNPSNEIGFALYRSTDGGVSYTFVASLPANTTSFNATSLLANTSYSWRIYSFRESISPPADGVGTTLPANKFFTIASGNWSDGTIWNTGTVPSNQDSAEVSVGNTVTLDITNPSSGTLIVKGNLNYWNISSNQTFTVNGDVIVEAGGTFSAGTGTGPLATPFILNIGGSVNTSTLAGNLIVNGNLDLFTTASVQTVFFGTQNATVTGSGATCDMPFILVNKGAVSSTLEFLRTYNQPSATSTYTFLQRLSVSTGTLKLSAPIVTNSIHTTTATLVTSVNARLWLNHSGIAIGVVPATTGIGTLSLQGELRIDAGSLNLGTGANSHFITTNGVLRLNGGSITLNGGLQVVAIASAQLIVSGGRLIIDPQGLQNLSNFTNAFIVNSSGTFVFTGGTIEIVDPHALAPSSSAVGSINIQSGGTRTITGGAFVIGDGVSTSSGGAIAANVGFNIISSVSLPKLIINNNYTSNNSRYCRIGSNITILDSLVVNTNGYLQTGSTGVGFSLIVGGHTLNDGIISGVFPTSVGPAVGSLNFESTSAQVVSGNGTTSWLSLRVANSSGVTFNNTTSWNLERITLESGNVTNSSGTITLGSTLYRGNLVIGGLNETTTAGSFSTIPTVVTTFGTPNYTYGPAANTIQTGSFNEMSAGAATFNNLTINDAQGVASNRNITVTGALTLTSGSLNMGNNALSIGTSTAITGSLNRTNGFVQLGTIGTFTRWFAAGFTSAYQYTSGFPLSTGTRERSVLFSTNGTSFTTGGSLTVKHGNVVGYTDISPSFTDGGVTINRRTNSYWLMSSTSLPNIGAGNTLSLRVVGEGVGSVFDATQLQLTKGTGIAQGTAVASGGTNSVPQINRDFSQTVVSGGGLFDSLFVGANSGVNPLLPNIIAINTGDWNNTNTWEGNIIPTVNNSATVASGVNVTIPTGYTATCNGLSITSGGTLTAGAGTLNNAASIVVDGTLNVTGSTVNVAGTTSNGVTVNTGGVFSTSAGTVNIGPGGGSDRTLLVNGTLTVTGGTVNVNGNLNIASTGALNQSGGDINVDGNSGLSATSLTAGTHLVSINSNTLDCSAGNITIVDPPHSSIAAGTTMALRITASSTLTAFTGTHTFVFGNGTSTEAGNSNGFIIDVRRSGLVPLQNVTVNAGSASGRWVSPSYTNGQYGAYIKGNLTINSGSEFRHVNTSTFVVGGDITNNGTLTEGTSMTLGGNSYYVISNAQTISGTGTFRNSTTTSTASFASVLVDNGVSLTLGSTNTTFSFSGTLNIGSIKVTTGTNTVALTSTGTLTRTSGYIVGNLSKNLSTGSNIARTYEIGNASNYLPVSVTFPSVTVAGNVAIGTTDGDHPQLATSCINVSKSINRYWRVTNVGSTNTGGNYTFTFNTSDVDAGTTLSSAKLFSYNGTAWLAGLTGTATTTTFAVNGLTNYGDVAIGEITPVPATISIAASSSNICVGTNVTFTATITNGGSTPAYQWKVNGGNVGTNSSTYSSTTLNNTDIVTCVLTSNSPCVAVSSVTSNTVTMVVSQPSVGGTVTGGTSICSGSNSGVLTLSGNTGSVVRWESAVSPFSTFTTISNTATTYTSGALTQTTQFRAVVQSGACASANSATTTVTVDAPSVAGTISGTNAVCSGLSAGNLTLSGNTGNVIRWESALAPFSTFTPIANTTNTQSAGSPTATIHYRAVVQNGSCAPINTTAFVITVTPSSVGGTVSSNQTICSGSNAAALTLTGSTGTVTKWQSSVDLAFTSPSDISGTSGLSSYTPTSVTSNTYYRAVVQSGSCATANSSAALITVTAAPVAGTLSGTNAVCSGNSPGNITLAGTTGTISFWQSNAGSGWVNISNTSATYNPGTLTTTTSYRAVVTSGTCTPDTAAAFTVTVTPSSVGGTVSSNQTICSGNAVAALNLAGSTGTVTKWQSSANVGFTTPTDIAGTSGLSSYTPTGVTTTTYYRAVVQSGACATANSSAALITVNPAPVAGTLSGTNAVCSGNSPGNITLSGTTGTISFWQSNAGSGWVNISNTSATYNPGTLTTTTSYRAVVTSGTCTPDTAAAFTVTVTPSSVGGTVSSNQTICSGNAVAALSLAGSTGTVTKWQSSANVGFTTPTDIAGTSGLTSYTPTGVTTTTYYRAVVQSGACAAANSSAALITVNPAPVAGTLSGTNAVCAGNSPGNITLAGTTGTISFWQSNAGSGWVNISNTSATYNPGTLTTTTSYRAVVTSGTCTPDTAAAFTVTVTPSSVGGTVSSNQTICSGNAVAALSLAGSTGTVTKWQSSANVGFTTPTDIAGTSGLTSYTPTGVTTTTYYRAVVQSGACATANSSAALITVNPAPVAGTLSGTNAVCAGNSPGNITLAGTTGTISFWQSNAGSGWVNISNTSATYNPGTLTTTTSYRAVVTSGTCTPDTAAAFTVTVNPAAVGGTVSSNQTICSGDPVAALTLTGSAGTITKWQSSTNVSFTSPTDIAGTSGLTSYTPTSVTATTYYRAVITSVGCGTANSTAALITVNPAAIGGTVTGSSPVCSGSSTNLFLSGQTGTVSKWQQSVDAPLFTTWTDISNTTTTLTTSALTQTTHFRAVITSGSCSPANSSEFEVQVTNSGIWVGAINSNWNNAANWCGGVPTAATNVVIPSGTLNSPLINVVIATANNVTVDAGATLAFTGSGNTIDIKGNLTVNGTFTTANGLVIFSGSTAQNVAGISYNALRMNGTGAKTLTGATNVTSGLDMVSGNLQLGNNTLSIGASATLNGNANSYIVTNGTGSLQIANIGASVRTFPVGSSSSYTPVYISNAGTADDISVKVLQDVYSAYAGEVGSGAPIAANVVRKSYIINEAVNGGSSLNIFFQWNGTDEAASFNKVKTLVGHYSGGVWSNISGTPNAASGTDPYSYSVSAVSTLGIFGVGDENSPLPVRLVAFNAKLKKGLTNLNWTTASEVNTSSFEIERSIDGLQFERIGFVKAKGNSSVRHDYNYIDAQSASLLESTSIIFYRLKQFDLNGDFEYSNVVSVNEFGKAVFEITSTVPNPFRSSTKITFKTSSTSPIEIQLTDAFGKLIKVDEMSPNAGSNTYQVELIGDYAPGVYFAKIIQDGNVKVVKLIKD